MRARGGIDRRWRTSQMRELRWTGFADDELISNGKRSVKRGENNSEGEQERRPKKATGDRIPGPEYFSGANNKASSEKQRHAGRTNGRRRSEAAEGEEAHEEHDATDADQGVGWLQTTGGGSVTHWQLIVTQRWSNQSGKTMQQWYVLLRHHGGKKLRAAVSSAS